MQHNQIGTKYIFATFWIGILMSLIHLQAQTPGAVSYSSSIQQWRLERLKELKSNQGGLNLEGLFWLHKGVNTFLGLKKIMDITSRPINFEIYE